MDYERRKRKYLDKLKKTSSSRGLKTDVGTSDIQNDNSLCFYESRRQYVEPNDLLDKVERYIKANPMSHITKNRLTVKRGFHQHGFQSNLQNRNNIDTDGTVYKSSTPKNVENIISFIKPKKTLVNYMPDTKIKFGPPNATSTIKHQQIQNVSKCSPKQNNESHVSIKKEIDIGENIYHSNSLSNYSSSPKVIRSDIQGFSSSISDKEHNKNKCTNIEEKAKLNLTYCLYLEYVQSHCDEIKSINEKIYPNNDYSIQLKKRLQQVKYKHQNIQDVNYTNLTSSSSPVINDESINSFTTISSESISRFSNFDFKPVIDLSNSPDKYASIFSQDSFVCFTQETLFTNTVNSMTIDKIDLELTEEHSPPSEIWSSENNNTHYQREIMHWQSRSTCLMSLDSSLDKSIQKSNNNQESSLENFEDSFKYYRKKMF